MRVQARVLSSSTPPLEWHWRSQAGSHPSMHGIAQNSPTPRIQSNTVGSWTARPHGGGVDSSPWVLPAVLVLAFGIATRRVWPRAAFVAIVAAVGTYLATGAMFGPIF
jgi:hypothetical protein